MFVAGAVFLEVFPLYYAGKMRLPKPGLYYIKCTNPLTRFNAVYYGITVSNATVPNSVTPSIAFAVGSLMRPPIPDYGCLYCYTGEGCTQLLAFACICNPCVNYDDVCHDATTISGERTCEAVSDSTGRPFYIAFMSNRMSGEPTGEDTAAMELVVVFPCLYITVLFHDVM